MTTLIALSWPLVALVVASALIWRADAWAKARWTNDAALEALQRLGIRLDELSEEHRVRTGAVIASIEQDRERLGKLEQAITPGRPPATGRFSDDALKQFR